MQRKRNPNIRRKKLKIRLYDWKVVIQWSGGKINKKAHQHLIDELVHVRLFCKHFY